MIPDSEIQTCANCGGLTIATVHLHGAMRCSSCPAIWTYEGADQLGVDGRLRPVRIDLAGDRQAVMA